MTALVLLATLALAEPDLAADPDQQDAEPEDEGAPAPWSVDAVAQAALADADLQAGSITARARAARRRSGTASHLWPRIALSVSVGGAVAPALDRTAGALAASRLARPRALVWSIVATWGAR